MRDINNEKVDKLTRRVLGECDIYPLPDEDEVKEEIRKVNRLIQNEADGVSEDRLVRRLTKSFEMKQRVDEDGWIKYEGNLLDLER